MKFCLGLVATSLAAVLANASGWCADGAVTPTRSVSEETPGCHGTAVNFVNTPSEAAKQAKKEEKLVFVLHVSGQFEDPTIT
ncbi:MAG TPA: hypothetical protein VGX70_01040 [Gemmataceae bacterium]|jgi:hypothetical protein|nr:hypothetical protein [Gemmataceae bacterium]